MNTLIHKLQENTMPAGRQESQPAAGKVTQKSSGDSSFQFTDKRPEATAQRKLRDIANNIQPIQRKPNNTGLPDNLKTGIENLSGYSMDDVKVHYNSPKPATLQVHAYAQGTDIHLASGQERHLPHEAWHVVQQKQGRVRPTIQMSQRSGDPAFAGKGNVNINDDAGLEKEADVMGGRAATIIHSPKQKDNTNHSPSNELNVVQRVGILATISSLATYALWGSSLATPLGLLSAYLVYRQVSESSRYRLGLSETQKNKLMESECTVHVLRTQRLSRWGDTYQDDHISLGVKINEEYVKQVGFWMDRSDYKDFTFLAVRNKGEVRNDQKKFGNSVDQSGEEIIKVTHEQAKAIIERIERDEKNPPKFSVTGYNGFTCVTWAHDVLSSNGTTLMMSNKILPPSPENLIPDSSMKDKKQ